MIRPSSLLLSAILAAGGASHVQAQSKPKSQAARPQATAAATTGTAQPQLLGQFGDWGAYAATAGSTRVCFALAKPSKMSTSPPNRPRDPAYMFISSRPGEKVKDEISVVVGYGFKPNTDASVQVSGSNFAMYTQSDGAWIKNAADEPRLVEVMRKSGDATVKGTSARGTVSTDVYSLKGLAQALDRVGQECH